MSTTGEDMLRRTQAKVRFDLVNVLYRIVDETAQITPQLGGFRITVTKPFRFPWTDVFTLLLDTYFDVWVTRTNDLFSIYAQFRSP